MLLLEAGETQPEYQYATKTSKWELGIAAFHRSGLLWVGQCLFLYLLLTAHART